ncbi:MAG TPA: hypothetical protein VGB46_10950 [Flavisolibacter sp.]|jgi:hypothetical protein
MLSITVKIEGVERRKRSASLLHIVAGCFLIAKGADYYRYLGYEDFLPVAPFFTVALISVIYGLFRRRIDPEAQMNYWLRLLQVVTFTILGALMVVAGRQIDYISLFLWTFVTLMLLISEKKLFSETELLLKEEGVLIPGIYRSHVVPWNELTNVIVRQDFVTIFHRDEKYLQYQVMQSLTDLELVKMNSFCREKIEKQAVSNKTATSN